MKYDCDDCKDRGFITLLLTRVECDCRRGAKPPVASKSSSHWINLCKGAQLGKRKRN